MTAALGSSRLSAAAGLTSCVCMLHTICKPLDRCALSAATPGPFLLSERTTKPAASVA
ncbi:hypothetical protein PF003_g17891 [Phytophthora fragariae]|nr:hypothetical protein PF003_g17891 [Phytophthora fragariae]